MCIISKTGSLYVTYNLLYCKIFIILRQSCISLPKDCHYISGTDDTVTSNFVFVNPVYHCTNTATIYHKNNNKLELIIHFHLEDSIISSPSNRNQPHSKKCVLNAFLLCFAATLEVHMTTPIPPQPSPETVAKQKINFNKANVLISAPAAPMVVRTLGLKQGKDHM